MTAMLKRTPERALKSHESFQVSFSSAGKMGIVESDATRGGAGPGSVTFVKRKNEVNKAVHRP